MLLALICFERETHKQCEEFDGMKVLKKAASKFSHQSSCLATYDTIYGPKTVAVSSYLSDGKKKVETYTGSVWNPLPDLPR